jgi:oligopeptide/dipeptide ABC transporter ATP-binding protein
MLDPVLEVRDLKTYLYTRWGTTRAVDGVSFNLYRGETVGIVGESGCGKSMLAMSLVRLTPRPASKIVGGEVLLEGVDLLKKSEREMRQIRGKKISMILQDPHQSLNPVFSIGNQLEEALHVHSTGATPLRQQAIDALRRVRVADPERRLNSYPHQLSGGMKQRVVGAMGLAFQPQVLVADEPTTALDVTIQAQYLALLKRVQRESGTSILIITHDFGVVAAICDRVLVMYAGRVVEQGPVRQIFKHPSHPYTQALIGALPRLEDRVESLTSIGGSPPALYDLPPGCHFAPRCAYARAACQAAYPPDLLVEDGHSASCWNVEVDPTWAPAH